MIPDVTGFTLGEAVSMLKAAGVTGIEVRITSPPRDKDPQYDSNSRVVRQIDRGNTGGMAGVELVVCNT